MSTVAQRFEVSRGALWFGLFGGAIAWTVHLMFAYAAAEFGCIGRLGERGYLGITLVPHAGVAIGLVLQIRTIFPEYAELISTIILASVLINEIIGPICTKYAITRAGEKGEVRVHAFEEL